MHRQQGAASCRTRQTATDRRAGARVPGQPAGRENLASTWMRSPGKTAHRRPGAAQRTGRPRDLPPTRRGPRTSTGCGRRVLDTLARPCRGTTDARPGRDHAARMWNPRPWLTFIFRPTGKLLPTAAGCWNHAIYKRMRSITFNSRRQYRNSAGQLVIPPRPMYSASLLPGN